MLQTVIFRSLKPDVYSDLSIPVVNANPSQPLFLRDITGIEPPAAVINSKGFGELDGEFYTGGNMGKRNITMKFGLNTNGGYSSVSTARTLLYGYAMTNSTVWLRFLSDDHPPADIVGYVESLTPTRFSDDPEMQLSIICPMPNFTSPDRKQFTGTANKDPDEVEINYGGNLATGIGVILDMGTQDYVGRVVFETRLGPPVYQTFELYSNTFLSRDDQLWLNTERGTKGVQVHRGSEVINMLGQMDSDSVWMTIVPGRNLFRVLTPSSDTPRGWVMSFLEQYGGI